MRTRFLPPAFGLAAFSLFAQLQNTGNFSGAVRDQSGASVTGVTVRVIRDNPLFTRETTTDDEGNYQVLQVPAGDYRIEFEKAGFQRTSRTGISLSAGQSLRVDATLNVGSVSETVQVDAKVAQVDTLSANVGSTVFGSQVQELALNTRSFTQLMTLQPGVASSQAQQPGFGSNTGVPFSFNGGQQSSNNWTLDGGRNIDTYNGNNLTMVNLDAIAEVRIERNAYSAEYGRNSGAQINVITRSGTNQFHGSAFEFFRNDKLDARNFFARTRPKNRYNNFGWTLGGPIKRDKVFFFLSNEYRRIYQVTSTRTGIVPTAAQTAGDFSAGRVITDPLTGQPFPGNRIPADRLDPNSLALVKNYYLPPNFQQGALNFTSSEPDGTKYRSALGRLDYNIRDNLNFFGRYNIDSTRLESPYGLFATNAMPGVAASDQSHIMTTSNATLNWTARPNLLNQLTSAWYHGSMAISTVPAASRSRGGFDAPRIFGTPGASGSFIPSISTSQGYTGISILWPQNISMYSFEVMDHVTWIKGRRTLKFGGSIDKENKSQNNSNPNNNGTFTFNGSVTGDALADLLIGQAFQYTENSGHVFGSSRFTNVGLYAQDQFRATQRLTLTLGLRWEFYEPEKDSDGLYSYFLPSRFDYSRAATILPSNGQIAPGTENFDNGVVLIGDNSPYGNAVTNTVYDTFAPRVGFSYALTDDNLTVFRGGYGMFHDRWSQFISGLRNNYPFNQSASIFNTSVSNPAQGTRRFFPVSLTNFASPWDIPYMQKWSLGVQRQLPAELLLDVAYVGSKGTHLLRTRDINQPAASVAVASGQLNTNAARPYPGFATINTYETAANSTYHSLQASVVRRLSSGISFQGSYTFSRSIDNALTPVNSYWNHRLDRGLSSFDRTHVAVMSYIWELPFFQNGTGWTRRAFGGWQFSGITRVESGNPLTIGIAGDRAGTGAGGQRPNTTGPIERHKTLERWFDTAPFTLPALGTFGTAGRGLVRGPGIHNWDMSFSKRTLLRENLSLQFRAEFFNIWNHTQWSGVGTTVGAGTFGQVTSARDPRITQLGLRLLF